MTGFEGGFFLPIGMPNPEEMKRIQDEHEMSLEAFRHDVQRLFDELSVDHLVTLRMLLHQIASGGLESYAAYLEGIAAATLHVKHNRCAGCGKDHNEELLAPSEKVDTTEPRVEPGDELMVTDDENLSVEENYKRNLKLFRVAHPEDLPGMGGPVVCVDCSYGYPSLEDRMLRSPDDCPGCHNKAKWG